MKCFFGVWCMWKKLLAWILVTVILTGYGIQIVEAFDQKENVRMEKVTEKPDQNSLYAKAAVLMDADSGRILYEKNGHQAMANASTDMYHCTGKLRPGQRSDRECTCSVTAESSSGYAGGAEVLSERSAVRTDVGIL